MNLRLLFENEVLHTRFLQLGNASGSLELLSLSAITRGSGQHPLFDGVQQVTIALHAPPTVLEDGDSLPRIDPAFHWRKARARFKSMARAIALTLEPEVGQAQF